MSAHSRQQHRPSPPRNTRGRLATGFAMLGGAIAWALHLCVMYFLVQPVCRLGGETWFHVVTGIALLGCVLAAVVAWRHREEGTGFRHLIDGEGSWKSFVALFGLVSSSLFAYAIVYQWLPVLTTAACEGIRPLQ